MNTLLTKGEVCLFFGKITPSTLYRQIKKGLIPQSATPGRSSSSSRIRPSGIGAPSFGAGGGLGLK
jgi:hypothetical protein